MLFAMTWRVGRQRIFVIANEDALVIIIVLA